MSTISNQTESILTKQQLEKDYKELKSLVKIAKKYNVSVTPIKSRFLKFKIPFESKINKYNCNHNIFSEESERAFYIAGFIAADGCIRISKTNKDKNHINHRVIIALADKDLKFLNFIKTHLNCENPIAIYDNLASKRNSKWNDTKIAKLSITSKQMVKDLEKFNIGARKSLTYNMPEWLMIHPLLHHFLRGYIDGDGSFYFTINEDNCNMCFSLRGTILLLNQVKNIFTQNDIFTDAKPRLSNGIGQLSVHSNSQVSKIVDFLYKDASIYLQRKYDIGKKAKEILFIKEDAKNRIKLLLEGGEK